MRPAGLRCKAPCLQRLTKKVMARDLNPGLSKALLWRRDQNSASAPTPTLPRNRVFRELSQLMSQKPSGFCFLLFCGLWCHTSRENIGQGDRETPWAGGEHLPAEVQGRRAQGPDRASHWSPVGASRNLGTWGMSWGQCQPHFGSLAAPAHPPCSTQGSGAGECWMLLQLTSQPFSGGWDVGEGAPQLGA